MLLTLFSKPPPFAKTDQVAIGVVLEVKKYGIHAGDEVASPAYRQLGSSPHTNGNEN